MEEKEDRLTPWSKGHLAIGVTKEDRDVIRAYKLFTWFRPGITTDDALDYSRVAANTIIRKLIKS